MWRFILALLLPAVCMPVAPAQPTTQASHQPLNVPREAVAEILNQWSAPLKGAPHHPLAQQGLDALASAYTAQLNSSAPPPLLAIAEDFADEDLGLFAFEQYSKTSSAAAGPNMLRQALDRYADTRLAAEILDALQPAQPDPVPFLQDIIAVHGKTAVAGYAKERLAEVPGAVQDNIDRIRLLLEAAAIAADHPARLAALNQRITILMRDQSMFVIAGMLPGGDTASPLEIRMNADLLLRMLDHSMKKDTATIPDTLRMIETHIANRNVVQFDGAVLAFTEACKAQSADSPDPAMILAGLQRYLAAKKQATPEPAWRAVLEHALTPLARTFCARIKALPASAMDPNALRALLSRMAEQYKAEGRYLAENDCLERMLQMDEGTPESAAMYYRLATVQAMGWANYGRSAESLRSAAILSSNPKTRHTAMAAEALDLYLAERYPEAQEAVRRALENVSDRNLRVEVRWVEILILDAIGAYDKAEKLTDVFLRDFKDTPTAQQALLLRAYRQFQRGDYNAVVTTCKMLPAEGLESHAAKKLGEMLSAVAARGKAGVEEKPAPAKNAPNVILISLDTVRADHLGCIGYSRKPTPNLDALAAEGAVFTRASSVSSWTKPAHAGLLTGRHPAVLQANSYDDALPPHCMTMAEYLGRMGYTTLGTVAAPPLNSAFGFNRGFDLYDDYTYDLDRECNLFRRSGMGEITIHSGYTASLMTRTALAQVDRALSPDRPFFLFLNYFDAHHNYEPPWPLREEYSGNYYGTQFGPIDPWVKAGDTLETLRPEIDAQRLRDLYDGELASLDGQIGAWVAALKERGLYDRTLWVVVSDHGEEFLDHGRLAHGTSLYQESVHVPIIIVGPGVPKGKRIETPVSLLDVLPTVLHLVGSPVPGELDGANLLNPEIDRPIYALLDLPEFRFSSVLLKNLKLIRNQQTKQDMLFDLATDPEEQKDIAATAPEYLGRLQELLDKQQERDLEARRTVTQGQPAKATPDQPNIAELMEQLRAMGYLGAP
jgi:arylsulfatase A-like enzyme